MTRRRQLYPQVRPYWHTETCSDCSSLYEELSDPAASLHLCHKCFRLRTGLTPDDAPLQRDPLKWDWWDRFVEEYERHKIAGDLAAWVRGELG